MNEATLLAFLRFLEGQPDIMLIRDASSDAPEDWPNIWHDAVRGRLALPEWAKLELCRRFLRRCAVTTEGGEPR